MTNGKDRVTIRDVYEKMDEQQEKMEKTVEKMVTDLKKDIKEYYVSRLEFEPVKARVGNNTNFRNVIISIVVTVMIGIFTLLVQEKLG